MPSKLIERNAVPCNIIMARQSMRMTQSEVADYLEMPYGTYSKIETGELKAGAFHLVEMAKLFDVKIESLTRQRSFGSTMPSWNRRFKGYSRKSLKLWLDHLGWELSAD